MSSKSAFNSKPIPAAPPFNPNLPPRNRLSTKAPSRPSSESCERKASQPSGRVTSPPNSCTSPTRPRNLQPTDSQPSASNLSSQNTLFPRPRKPSSPVPPLVPSPLQLHTLSIYCAPASPLRAAIKSTRASGPASMPSPRPKAQRASSAVSPQV